MLKLFLSATVTLLVTLATLTACSDTTPAPEEVPTPTPVSSRVAAPASTDAPVSTHAPTERPTAAPKATPASTPTPEPTATPVSLGVLAPLRFQDSEAMLSELSDTELACIGDDPEKLARALTGQGPGSPEEQARFLGCMEDETLARIFLAGFVPAPRPLSPETSDCVRAAFEVIDPRAVMTAGIEGDPGRAMAGSMTGLFITVACLNDEEWDAAASMMGMRPEERERMQCLLDQLGGPGEMAEAAKAAGEGDFTDLARSGADCGLDTGLDMGPAPGQASVTPLAAPTAIGEAPTVVSTPVPVTATSTPVPTGAAPTTTTTTTMSGPRSSARNA